MFQIHGGRRNEGQVLVDGMNGGYQGMGVSGYVPEVGNAQEVVFSLSGGLGEATTGGPQMNIIPQAGRQPFRRQLLRQWHGDALQGEQPHAGADGPGTHRRELDREAVGRQPVVRRPDRP